MAAMAADQPGPTMLALAASATAARRELMLPSTRPAAAMAVVAEAREGAAMADKVIPISLPLAALAAR
jgi:hypothetical protein